MLKRPCDFVVVSENIKFMYSIEMNTSPWLLAAVIYYDGKWKQWLGILLISQSVLAVTTSRENFISSPIFLLSEAWFELLLLI